MDFPNIQRSDVMNNYKKCGYILKPLSFGEEHNLLLTCFHCEEIFWQLKTFLEHLSQNFSATAINETSIDYQESIVPKEKTKNLSEILISNDLLCRQNDDCRNDPLREEYKECKLYSSKTENTNAASTIEVIGKEITNDAKCKVNEEYDGGMDMQLHKVSDVENVIDDIIDVKADNEQLNADPESSNLNLKLNMKNRRFIRYVIEALKQHMSLWNTKTKCSHHYSKSQCLHAIAQDINKNFNSIFAHKEVDMIIKRLKKLFLNQYQQKQNCMENGDDYKPLWFYEELKFLEPHLKSSKKKTNFCEELTNEQLQVIIKLLKENECFWNAENIYHTSVVYKQECLKKIVKSYASTFKHQKLTASDLMDIIEELKVIVVNENKERQGLYGIESMASHKAQQLIYNDLAFLSPHVGPFRCEKCSKIYMDIYAYKFHASTHDASKAFKCMICQKELAHKKGFMCHLRRHTKECPYKCDQCDKSFPSRKERQRHIIKHGSKPYVCELCAHTFFTQHQLTNHMKNHSNIRDHVCTQCGKGFTHRGLLRQHLQTHDKTECVCSLCNNVYANPRSLRKHYVRVHEDASRQASTANHGCNICMITFATLLEAKHHRKEHKQSLGIKRKHVCDVCGHDFAYPRNLADHKKIHSNIRDQVCDICGKAFTNVNLLNQHKNVHNGQKFECKICGKYYAHYRGLCRHMNKVHQSCVKDVNIFTEKETAESNISADL